MLTNLAQLIAALSGRQRAKPPLAHVIGHEVLEPGRLHAHAQRCLVAIDTLYAATLTPASLRSLALQGAPMDPHCPLNPWNWR